MTSLLSCNCGFVSTNLLPAASSVDLHLRIYTSIIDIFEPHSKSQDHPLSANCCAQQIVIFNYDMPSSKNVAQTSKWTPGPGIKKERPVSNHRLISTNLHMTEKEVGRANACCCLFRKVTKFCIYAEGGTDEATIQKGSGTMWFYNNFGEITLPKR